MAKRRRLTLAAPQEARRPVEGGEVALLDRPAPAPAAFETPFARETAPVRGPAPSRPRAPIAAAAGEAAAAAALEEVAGAMRAAREEGRLVEALALDAVEAEHLMRDRMGVDEGEMAALVASLRAHGQRTPIEVTPLGAAEAGGEPARFGLISGWRRLAALRRLHHETGEARFATVRALVRRPEDAAGAYVAMVEENEIRAGLSHFERARLVMRAAEAGVFADEDAALRALFGAGSPARRSKIKSFVPLVRSLGDRLAHPAAIPERLGLALAQALRADEGLAARIAARLDEVGGGRGGGGGAEVEAAVLRDAAEGRGAFAAGRPPARAPRPEPRPDPRAEPEAEEVRPGLRLAHRPRRGGGEIVLSGPAADETLRARLAAWLGAES